MKPVPHILLLLAAAFLMSLGSCVNEVKNPDKIQLKDSTHIDSLAHLEIVYDIPDSNSLNSILNVKFHAVLTPGWKKHYRIDWNFGDETGVISKFDTSGIFHYYQDYGSYTISLSIFDTIEKIKIGTTSLTINLINNAMDSNYLHGFTNISISFSSAKNYDKGLDSSEIDMSTSTNSKWVEHFFNSYYYNSSEYFDTAQQTEYGQSASCNIMEKISYSGNRIDSGYVEWNLGESSWARMDKEWSNRKIIINYRDLPLIKRDANMMVFSSAGSQLKSLILQFSDETDQARNIDQWVEKKLIEVLWDHLPTPMLTVTFSK
jgi:hypothetical protein